MKLRISKWGNSQGVRLPKQLLEEAGASDGLLFDATVADGNIILTPVRQPEYSIHDLVKQIEPAKQGEAFDWGKPMGREVW